MSAADLILTVLFVLDVLIVGAIALTWPQDLN
jgi:hypothetical protein